MNDHRADLYLGLVGAVGTDFDEFISTVTEVLGEHGYKTIEIHLSQLLEHVKLDVNLEHRNETERLDSHMNAGDRFRQMMDRGDAVGLLGIGEVSKQRGTDGGSTAFVFRSLKHPSEVQLLRDVYHDSFFLIGLFSTETERCRVLENKGVDKSDCNGLMTRDENDEKNKLGQRTRDTFELADVFVRMSPSNLAYVKKQCHRFFDLVFGSPAETPTEDEHAMYLAYAASLRSADLSRQVGASIVSAEGDVLAVGANDVPKAEGGLYWPGELDRRDHVRKMDSNEQRKVEIARDVFNLLYEGQDEQAFSEFVGKMADSLLFDITEYGRAVHAEMEALLSCARSARSTRHATLYSTTYPCHNCAKHIVASGVARVVFVEPYPKSRALALHDDAICVEEPSETGEAAGEHKKVVFEPFIGVGPRRYIDLFSMKLSSGYRVRRKSEGRLMAWDRRQAPPRVPVADSIQQLESEAVAVLHKKMEGGDETETTAEQPKE